MGLKYLLHAGCGSKTNKPPYEFAAYKEVRLDCNPQVAPDVVASIVAMPMIADASYDALFASHVLEHLYAHEVAMALLEFARVLKPGGKIMIQVPDLEAVGSRLALDQADHVVYTSHIGAITPLDILYGHQGSVGTGNLFMAHKTGFTRSVLKTRLQAAGFSKVELEREQFEIKARAHKPEVSDAQEERTGREGTVPREAPEEKAERGAAPNGHREVPERTLRETGLPCAAGG